MITASVTGRRSGAVMLVDDQGCLSGIFTDSDLARLLEARCDKAFDEPIESRMTVDPLTTEADTLLTEAMALMSHRKISELPVIDAANQPIGMLDITDVVSLSESSSQVTSIPIQPQA